MGEWKSSFSAGEEASCRTLKFLIEVPHDFNRAQIRGNKKLTDHCFHPSRANHSELAGKSHIPFHWSSPFGQFPTKPSSCQLHCNIGPPAGKRPLSFIGEMSTSTQGHEWFFALTFLFSFWQRIPECLLHQGPYYSYQRHQVLIGTVRPLLCSWPSTWTHLSWLTVAWKHSPSRKLIASVSAYYGIAGCDCSVGPLMDV